MAVRLSPETVRSVLENTGAALIFGAPGIGKRTIAVSAARARGGSVVRRTAAEPWEDLPPTPADAATALAADATTVVVDDAHRMTVHQAAVIESVISRGLAPVILTARSGPWIGAGLANLRRRRLVAELLAPEPDAAGALDVLQQEVAPARVEQESADRLLALAGGVPLLIAELVRTLAQIGALRDTGGHLVWDGTRVPRPVLRELGGVIVDGLPDDVRHAATALGLAGVMHLEALASVAGSDAVDELLTTGLVRLDSGRIAFRQDLAAMAVAAAASDTQRRALLPAITAAIDADGRPSHLWQPEEMRAYVRLCVETDTTAPIDLLRRVWRSERGKENQEFLRLVTSGVLAHPDATASERTQARADRIEALRALGADDDARADAVEPAEPGSDAAAIASLAVASARLLQFVDGDDARADLVLAQALETLEPGTDPHAAVRVQRATLRGFAGHVVAARRALDEVLKETSGVTRLPAVAPAAMLAAQAGDLRRAKRLVERAFPIALLHTKDVPWAPGEIVVASFYADYLAGRMTQAGRIQRRIESVLARSRHDLPPYDVVLASVGTAMMRIADGAWSDAAEMLDDAIVRFGHRDPYGQRPYVLAHLAFAHAASGDRARAQAVIVEAREGRPGASRVSSAYLDILLLTAELWCGSDVSAEALELAGRMRAEGLGLMELRALHIVALAQGAQTSAAVMDRALAVADRIDAPIAGPLTDHIAELRGGQGRLAGPAARQLARHGLIVPPTATAAALTPREREVAIAASLGYASKTIASRFGNSKRTIDTHLARIYVKLGVAGRDDLADVLD